MLSLNSLHFSSDDYSDDEKESPCDLESFLFTTFDEVNENWVDDLEECYNSASPSEKNQVAYGLTTRLIDIIREFVKQNTFKSEKKCELDDAQNENENVLNDENKQIPFEEGLRLLEDDIPESFEESQEHSSVSTVASAVKLSQKDIQLERQIQVLQSKVNKWKILAKERLKDLARDIEFRDRLIDSIINGTNKAHKNNS